MMVCGGAMELRFRKGLRERERERERELSVLAMEALGIR